MIDVVGLLGAGCLIGGVAWIHPASGLIVAGVLFLAFAVLYSRTPADRRSN